MNSVASPADLDRAPRAPRASAPARPRSVWVTHPFLAGLLLLSLVSIAGSAWESLRIPLGPLAVHPFMVPAALLFVGVALPRLTRFPANFRLAAVIFFLFYVISTIPQRDGQLSEAIKLGAFLATMMAVAAAIAVLGDAKLGVLGLCIGVAIMAAKGLLAGGEGIQGVNPLGDLANKNAYSVYALPAIALGGFYLLEERGSRLSRLVIGACCLLTAWAIFASGNRSGWIGVALIVVLLGMRSRGVQTRLVLGMLVIAGYFLVTRITGTEAIDHRVEQTQQGYRGDESREELFRAAMDIGLENPILGVSPQGLQRELARRLHSMSPQLDPHNTFTHLFAGSGLVTLGAFFFLGWTICTRRPARRTQDLSPRARLALSLLRLLVVVFVVRGMFSRELIYNPAVAAAFGVAMGMALHAGLWRRPPRRAALATTTPPASAPAA